MVIIIIVSQTVIFHFNRRSIHRSEKSDTEFLHSASVFVYVVHLAFMILFGFTSMHVQVSKCLSSFWSHASKRYKCKGHFGDAVQRGSGFILGHPNPPFLLL